MLKLIVLGEELYDEVTQEFTSVPDVVLELEHSLISLSKWESKFQKPFLGPGEKNLEETIGYIEAMIINNYDNDVLKRLSNSNFVEINSYIASNYSATTFNQLPSQKGRPSSEIITSELIYYWMVAFNIPFDCETWHLNRLFSLIQICNIKNSKPKKMSRNEIAARNHALNQQRKAQLKTSG